MSAWLGSKHVVPRDSKCVHRPRPAPQRVVPSFQTAHFSLHRAVFPSSRARRPGRTLLSTAPLADFTECMRSLGYPRIISVENFRNPNFELVADCLDWLVQRFDESADIDDDISTETDRVTFLKNVSKVFMSRARLKLNIKELYAADGYARPRRPPLLHPPPTLAAHFQITERHTGHPRSPRRPSRPSHRLAVKELLKIANLLYQATKNADEDDATDPEAATDAFELDAGAFDVKLVRRLAADHAEGRRHLRRPRGREAPSRGARERVGRDVDLDEIEAQVQEQIASVRDNVQGLERTLGDETGRGIARVED